MAHGYLGDGWGEHGDVGDDRSDDRDRHWRESGRREEARRDPDDRRDHDRDRDSGMMFGSDRDWSGRDRWSNEWDREPMNRGYGSGASAEFREGRGSFSAHPDDHYRSWRERHMSEVDRDYEDYCREREQRFHNEFDAWRQQRHANYQPLRTGMTNTGMSHDPSGQVQVATEGEPDVSSTDPMADATLGTSDEASTGGRRRR